MEIVSNKKPVNHVFHKTHGVCRHTSCWTSKLCPPEMLSDLYGQNIWWRICFLLAGDISRSGMHHMSGCGFLTTDNLLFGVMVLVFLNPKNGITVLFGHNFTNPGSIPSPKHPPKKSLVLDESQKSSFWIQNPEIRGNPELSHPWSTHSKHNPRGDDGRLHFI